MRALFDQLKELAEFKKACEVLKEEEARTWEEHQVLVLIPAFSLQEEEKALEYQKMLEEEGFTTVRDEVNNIYTVFQGSDPKAPTVYMSAHIDTVFPMDTPLKITEKDGRFCCPGIGDDTASLAQVFGIMRAIRKADIRFKGTLIIGGNVGEEGLGDLYGMKHFFYKDHPSDIDGFITVDGCGNHIIYGGTGSHRYEVTFRGPGGHSNGDFGMPNPIHAMGRAIARLSDMRVPSEPKTTFSVGIVHGGTSVNAIAGSCSMLVDLRSNGTKELDALDQHFHQLTIEAVTEENQRWEKDRALYSDRYSHTDVPLYEKKVELSFQKIGERPVGDQPFDSLIVQAARNAYEALGITPEFIEKGSLDANIPISMGIPGLGLESGGETGGAHSLNEWYIPSDIATGQSKLILLLMGLLGVEGFSDPLLPKRNP